MLWTFEDVAEIVPRWIPWSFVLSRPLLNVGWSRTLEMEDLPKLRQVDDVALITERVERSWDAEMTSTKPSLYRALTKAFAGDLRGAFRNGTMWVFCLILQASILRPLVDALAAVPKSNLNYIETTIFSDLVCVAVPS